MMGANYRQGHQHERDMKFSSLVAGLSAIGLMIVMFGYFVYHTISSLLHYVMG